MCPTGGHSGYVTPAVSGIPTASERGAKSEVAHLWAKWLRHPCRLGDPHRFRAGGKIRNGPQVGKVATSPLLSRGSPPLQSGGQNQKRPTSGQSGYVTPAISGIPTASERGGGGGGSEVAHLWAKWLRHPCRLGDQHGCRAEEEIRCGRLVGKVATSPLPSRGSPPLQSGGGKSEVAHLWAKWLRHPCRLGDPHRFKAGGGNQKWPTCGQSGYVTPAVSGFPTASERGAKPEVAHKWAKWLRHPCRLGDPHRFAAEGGGGNQKRPTSGQSGYVTPAVSGIPTASERGGKIRNGPQVGKVATSPLPSWGSPPLQSGGGNQKWPTSGLSGYVTPAVSGIPTAVDQGGEIRSGTLVGKVAMSPLPSRGSRPLESGEEIRNGPQLGKVATSPVPSRGSPPLQSRGEIRSGPQTGLTGWVVGLAPRCVVACGVVTWDNGGWSLGSVL